MFALIDDKAVVLIPKAGATSISEVASRCLYELPSSTECIAFIRHPIDRLKSCYQFLHAIDATGTQYQVNISSEYLVSYEAFIDYMLTNDDEHWLPQAKLSKEASRFFRFEEINKIWPLLFSSNLPHLNSSEDIQVPKYRHAELLNYYSEDILLWLSL
tara:strand:+ start:751 stop:1224 length:474 start_codon:yes stop_codon:yes gene_type:complete